MLIQKNWF